MKVLWREYVNERKFRVSVFNFYCIIYWVFDNDKLNAISFIFFIEIKEKYFDFLFNVMGSIGRSYVDI